MICPSHIFTEELVCDQYGDLSFASLLSINQNETILIIAAPWSKGNHVCAEHRGKKKGLLIILVNGAFDSILD